MSFRTNANDQASVAANAKKLVQALSKDVNLLDKVDDSGRQDGANQVGDGYVSKDEVEKNLKANSENLKTFAAATKMSEADIIAAADALAAMDAPAQDEYVSQIQAEDAVEAARPGTKEVGDSLKKADESIAKANGLKVGSTAYNQAMGQANRSIMEAMSPMGADGNPVPVSKDDLSAIKSRMDKAGMTEQAEVVRKMIDDGVDPSQGLGKSMTELLHQGQLMDVSTFTTAISQLASQKDAELMAEYVDTNMAPGEAHDKLKDIFDTMSKASPAVFDEVKKGVAAIYQNEKGFIDFNQSFAVATSKASSSDDLRAIAALGTFQLFGNSGEKGAGTLGEMLEDPAFAENYDALSLNVKQKVDFVIAFAMKGDTAQAMQMMEKAMDSASDLSDEDKKKAFSVLNGLADKFIPEAKVDKEARNKQAYLDAIKSIGDASPLLAPRLGAMVDGEGAEDSIHLKAGLASADLTKPGDVEGLKKVIAYRFPGASAAANQILDGKGSPELKKELLYLCGDLSSAKKDAAMNAAAGNIKTKDDLDAFVAAAKSFGLDTESLELRAAAGVKYDENGNIAEGAVQAETGLFVKKDLQAKFLSAKSLIPQLHPDLEKKYGSVEAARKTPEYQDAMDAAQEAYDNVTLALYGLEQKAEDGDVDAFEAAYEILGRKLKKLSEKEKALDDVVNMAGREDRLPDPTGSPESAVRPHDRRR